ncbi:hypothetical protein RR46_08460 [Papilio xuthus]|uniref:Uncharacterized protein n=1 Tax=Papilio xuthus TaxID=66420 RepID=A0A194PH48_PAPXU|nr:hypothetical protein RR46_08460 [Papilio xuthus]
MDQYNDTEDTVTVFVRDNMRLVARRVRCRIGAPLSLTIDRATTLRCQYTRFVDAIRMILETVKFGMRAKTNPEGGPNLALQRVLLTSKDCT